MSNRVNYRRHDPDECTHPYHFTSDISVPCGACFNCRRSRTRGMQMSDNLRAWEARVRDNHPVQAMPQLPDQSQRLASYAVSLGTPKQHVWAILDADALRRRSHYLSPERRSEDVLKLLKKLAATGTSPGEPDPGPLFWCFGVREYFRKTAFPHPPVEPHSSRTSGNRIYSVTSPSSLQYRALASWACRLLPPDPCFRSLCVQVHNSLQSGETPGGWGSGCYTFPSPEARSWVTWALQLRQVDGELPEPQQGTGADHFDRWTRLVSRSEEARRVVALLSQFWINNGV